MKTFIKKRNLFWLDFENMKEFNNYNIHHNVSNVLKLIGLCKKYTREKSSFRIGKNKLKKHKMMNI